MPDIHEQLMRISQSRGFVLFCFGTVVIGLCGLIWNGWLGWQMSTYRHEYDSIASSAVIGEKPENQEAHSNNGFAICPPTDEWLREHGLVKQNREENEEIQNNQTVVVEISGAVIRPGVYEVPRDERWGDVLVRAGGLASDADANRVARQAQLAASVSDAAKLYIPFQIETSAQESICQEILTQPLIIQNESRVTTTVSRQGTSASQPPKVGGDQSEKISVNTATSLQLQTLSGIGEKRAEDIIAQRPYASLDELVTKGAIGNAVFNSIKSELTL